MSKIITILHIPEPKIRKAQAKATKKHKDKAKYYRKNKHKAPEWGLPFAQISLQTLCCGIKLNAVCLADGVSS